MNERRIESRTLAYRRPDSIPTVRALCGDRPGRERGLDLELEHQADVDDPHALVRRHDDGRPRPPMVNNPFGVWYVDPGAVRQADRERPEWLGMDQLIEVLGSHVRLSRIDAA